MVELEKLFSTEHHNVVLTALRECAKDNQQDIYDFLEKMPKTSLVAELTDKIYELGYKIVKQ